MASTEAVMTLGQILHSLVGRQVRPTEVLFLLLGKQEWTLAEHMREQLTIPRSIIDLYWDAYLLDEGQIQQGLPGIYLFGPDGQPYRAFEISSVPVK